jgi:hypothetical protein
MHQISENLIFNTKSPQIFSTAVRCDCFGAILAVHFIIKGTQSFPLITHLISLPKLSQTLSQSLSNSVSLSRFVQQKKGRRRSEEASRKLSFSWVISLVLFLSFSPSLFSLSVTCSKEEEDTKERKEEKE